VKFFLDENFPGSQAMEILSLVVIGKNSIRTRTF